MAGLQNCATELVLDIYLQLDNIDDALHLARCSRHLNAIFDIHRFHILESIILYSNIHVYDVMLCHFQNAFQDFSSKHLSNDYDSTPAELRPTSAHFEKCLHTTSISDRQVWDIVARWQCLRPLQHLYMNSVVKSKHIESPCVTGDESPSEREILDILRLAQTEREIGDGDDRATTMAFSLSETGHFYKALTGYWVATESLNSHDSAATGCNQLKYDFRQDKSNMVAQDGPAREP